MENIKMETYTVCGFRKDRVAKHYDDMKDERPIDIDVYTLYFTYKYYYKFKLTVWIETGSCYSGYCDADYLYMEIKNLNREFNIDRVLHYKPKHDIKLSLPLNPVINEKWFYNCKNDVFEIDMDNDDYYPCSEFNINMDLFEQVVDVYDKRAVLLINNENHERDFIIDLLISSLNTNLFEVRDLTKDKIREDEEITESIIVYDNQYTKEDIISRLYDDNYRIVEIK